MTQNAMYPSIQMSTNLSRISRYASTVWMQGCPYSPQQLNQLHENWKNCADPKQAKKLEKIYEAAAKANFEYIESFFEAVFTPMENAVRVCHEHFGLPDFKEMEQYF